LDNIESVCLELRGRLEESVKRNLTDGILLSGGIDTSILAVIASRYTSLKAVTVALKDAPAPDVEHAELMAEKLELDHTVHKFGEKELHEAMREVVRIRKSFDPMEVRNSSAIHIGLKIAKRKGVSTVMTGDASDELFAGYSFLFGSSRDVLERRLRRIWDKMTFSSIPMARVHGLEARLPYLDPEFKRYAMELDPVFKIREERGRVYGKWILYKAYEEVLPEKIAWRVKMPIEYGSGTTTLPEKFEKSVSDEEFNDKRVRYRGEVEIRDKEHLFYYEMYRSIHGPPSPEDMNGVVCPMCTSNVDEGVTHCRTCGAFPIRPLPASGRNS